MPTAFGQPTTLSTLLEKLAAQLVSCTGLSSDRVFESLASDAAHLSLPPADRFVAVGGLRFPVDRPGVAGGGRTYTGFEGTVRIALFSRLATDQELRHTAALRAGSKSALAMQDRIIDGLQLFTPVDSSARNILREPMRVVEWSVDPRDHKDGSAWVVIPSVWSVKFTQSLT